MDSPGLPRSVLAVTGDSPRLPLLELNPNRFKAPASRSLQGRKSDPQLTKEQRLRQQFEFLRGKNNVGDPRAGQPQHDAYQDSQPYAVSTFPRPQSIVTPGLARQQPPPVPVWYQVPGTDNLSQKPLYLRPSDVPHILSQLDDSAARYQQEAQARSQEVVMPMMQLAHSSPPISGPDLPPQEHQSILQNEKPNPPDRPWSPNIFVPPRPPVFPALRQKLEREKERANLASQSQPDEAKSNDSMQPCLEKTKTNSMRKSPAAPTRRSTRVPKRQGKENSTGAEKPQVPKRRKQDHASVTCEATKEPSSHASQPKPRPRRNVSRTLTPRFSGKPKPAAKTAAASKGKGGQNTTDPDYMDSATSKLMDMEEYFKSAKHAFCPETVEKMATNLFGLYLCCNDDYWDQVEQLMDG